MDLPDHIRKLLAGINVWSNGEQRAPHKPLLILLVLGSWSRYQENRFPYRELASELGKLLKEFGPPRKSFKTHYPFWRLHNDGIWSVSSDVTLSSKSGDVSHRQLLDSNAIGHLDPSLVSMLSNKPDMIQQVARLILEGHFAESLHADILQAVGLDYQYSTPVPKSRTRDPGFRYDVLMAYEERCAVCGFDVRLSGTLIGLEAAHIKWFQAGGPDTPDNGLALCSLHHKLLDRGAFTFLSDGTVCVSQRTTGSTGHSDWLTSFHGRRIADPVSNAYQPNPEFIAWHRSEVFKGPERD